MIYLKILFLVLAISNTLSCSGSNKPIAIRESKYPIAHDLSMVGHYPALTKSGAGYVYDKVLEYRVWIDNGTDDRYEAFATYEEAKEYSQRTKNAEEPLVLVLQEEYINEPSSGVYEHKKEKRITEWQVGWLKGSLRSENPIPEYIEKLKAVK